MYCESTHNMLLQHAKIKIEKILANYESFYVMIGDRIVCSATFLHNCNVFRVVLSDDTVREWNLMNTNELNDLLFTQFSLYVLSSVF